MYIIYICNFILMTFFMGDYIKKISLPLTKESLDNFLQLNLLGLIFCKKIFSFIFVQVFIDGCLFRAHNCSMIPYLNLC